MSTVTVKIISSFGCMCGGCCHCQTCGKGREYTVTVRNSDTIQTIWDDMCTQNPELKSRNVKPFMLCGKEVLDLERRVINYDISSGTEIIAVIPSHLCCITVFRKDPELFSDDEQSLEVPQQKQMGAPSTAAKEIGGSQSSLENKS